MLYQEKVHSKQEKVWTNCGLICTLGTSIQKNLSVKSVMTPFTTHSHIHPEFPVAECIDNPTSVSELND